MRSYWMSLTLVAVLLAAYTALVLNAQKPAKSASADLQPREPAQATTTSDEAAANVN